LTHKQYDSPEAVELAFYDALEHADLEALMSLWSEDDEIVYIPPAGARIIGQSAIRAAWRDTFRNGPVQVRPTQPHIVSGATVSVHSIIEQVMVHTGGKNTLVNLVATNVYFKGARGWRLVLHHASPTPDSNAPREAVKEGYLH